MSPITEVDLRFDVTAVVPLKGTHQIAASLFLPPPGLIKGRPKILFCLHGGSYSKTYYNMQIEGYESYSFAEYMARLGFLVVTVDDLGVGQSSKPEDELNLTMDLVAAANAEVVRLCVKGMERGLLTALLPQQPKPYVIGLGHSMGGMLTIYQQAKWKSFDAIGILGFSPFGWGNTSLELTSPFAGAASWSDEELLLRLQQQHLRAGYLGYQKIQSSKMRFYHHWEDVPEAIMAAEDAVADCLPGIAGVTGQVPGLVNAMAGEITCPVYIHWGEREPFVFDPHRDVTLFKSSWDVTMFVQPHSGHSHNLASTRKIFWDRLNRWVACVLPEN